LRIIDVLAICLIEFNRIEFPPPLLSSWYLDFGATCLVNDNPTIFSNMQHVSDNNLCSIGGQRHDIAHITMPISNFLTVLLRVYLTFYALLQAKFFFFLLGSSLIKIIVLNFFQKVIFCKTTILDNLLFLLRKKMERVCTDFKDKQ